MKADLKRLVVRLIFALVIMTAAVCPAEEPHSTHFYFAQITDTHLGDGDSLERTRKIVRQINGLPVEMKFVAHTGDITNGQTEDEALTAVALSTLGGARGACPLFGRQQ